MTGKRTPKLAAKQKRKWLAAKALQIDVRKAIAAFERMQRGET